MRIRYLRKIRENYKVILIAMGVGFFVFFAFSSDNKEVERVNKNPSFTSVESKPTLTEDGSNIPSTAVNESLWSNVSAGRSNLNDLKPYLGEIKQSSDSTEGKRYEFNLFSESRPVEAVTDEKGMVKYLRYPKKELVPRDFADVLENMGFTYVDPDLEVYFRGQLDVNRVYVYLDEGIAFEVKIDSSGDGMLTGVRYFVPVTEDEFMRNWGTDLVKAPAVYGH